jgi:hypothetical protein
MKNKSYELHAEKVRKIGESEPERIMIMSIEGTFPDDVYGFVVEIKTNNKYRVQRPNNENVVVEIPPPLDYTLGDEFCINM